MMDEIFYRDGRAAGRFERFRFKFEHAGVYPFFYQETCQNRILFEKTEYCRYSYEENLPAFGKCVSEMKTGVL